METQKRAAGEGSIDWRHGRARVRLRLPSGKRKTFLAPPEVQDDASAEGFRRALLLQLAGTIDDPRAGGATLGAFGLQWLRERAKTHRDASGDEQRWNAYIAGTPIAEMKLSAITPGDMLRWAKKMLARKSRRGGLVDRQTASNAMTTLRACIRSAIEAEAIDADAGAALLGVELPRGTIAQHVEHDEGFDVLAHPEVERVLALPISLDQSTAFRVGLFAMLRESELHALEWSRVVLDGPMPHVVIAQAKNGKTQRVPLLEPARLALHELWIARGEPKTGLVWPNAKGNKHARGYDWGWSTQRERRPLRSLTLLRERERKGDLRIAKVETDAVLIEWPGLRERAGIERAITWHEATRHTGASQLLMGLWWARAGIIPRAYRLEEVSRMLRHSSIAVTERHYARFLPDAIPGAMREERAPETTPPPSAPKSLPAAGPDAGSVGSVTPLFSKPLPGFEPGTYGLRNPGTAREIAADSGEPDPRGAMRNGPALRELATEVLRLIAAGDRRGYHRAAELAAAVLDATAVAEEPNASADTGRPRDHSLG
jgi:integrase